LQLQPSAGLSSVRSLQQSTILVLHAKDQRRKCDMAWAEFFYSANIPFAAARSASFKKAVKMTLEMRTSYFFPSYQDICKKLLNETKHKIKAQIAERTKMFIRTYGATLARDGWSSVNNHPLLNMMCVSPTGEEFLGAIDTSGHMKDAVYIADVIKRYLIEVGPKNVVQVCTDIASVKEALKQTVTDIEWDTYVRTLSNTQRKPIRTQARELRRLILGDDSEFWQSCANYCTVMKAAVVALKEFDGKQPCMNNVYMIMRALRHHVAALHNALFNMPSDLMEPFEVVLRNREALVASDLHYVGALLNPHLIKDMELRDDQNTMAGLMRVFQRLTDTAEEFQAVKAEFNLYFHTMSPYCGEYVWSSMGVKEVPYLWWFISVSVGKLLPRIARRILAQVVSSSSCEQNWNSYSFVHSKVRNRLLPSRAEDLVYVYTNSRVLNQNVPYIDEAATKWYRQTVVSEDSDSEGPADLFDDYDDVSDFDTPNMSIDDENTQGRSEE
jgi:hypothetical protein